MKAAKYTAAAAEILLLFPAALFMSALFVRNLQPIQYEPAHTAQQIVNWYAARTHVGLWIFLIALPFTVLLTGCAILWSRWRNDAELRLAAHKAAALVATHLASFLIAGTTLLSAGTLAIVALHVLTD